MGSGGEATVAGRVVSVLVVVESDPDLEPEEGDRLARPLRAEVAELDVESVALSASGAVPDGAKGADPVIYTLRDWLGRQSARHRISMTIDGDTIELERASAGQQQALVDVYVQRHTSGRSR